MRPEVPGVILAPAMTPLLILAIAATLLYGLCGWWAWHNRTALARAAPIAVGLHLIVLAMSLIHHGSLRIGVIEAASLFSWQAALLLFLFSLREPISVNGAALYPLAGLFLIWSVLRPSPVSNIALSDWRVSVHILLSLLSAGLLTLAAAQAMALATQERVLHHHRVAPAASRMPPLQTMERILFQLVAVGFALLSLTLLSGLWFIHDWLAQHLAHKTVLSITAWLIFGVLLWGRWHYGWRGRTATRWALAGYATLIAAYFGSKVILELLLGKHWV
jgi:ABC-type uncharacterized transport system permease subunit